MPTENCSSDWDPPPLCARCASSKRRRISQAQAQEGKLGDDVLVQILIRLPDPRSASRCRCVCKRWSSLIFSPDFNRLFVPRHMSRNSSEPPRSASPLVRLLPLHPPDLGPRASRSRDRFLRLRFLRGPGFVRVRRRSRRTQWRIRQNLLHLQSVYEALGRPASRSDKTRGVLSDGGEAGL
ncbi:unnamed protein product [Linum tenue]|uniref:F-box domain-containing protein n=1 Tax=Linum tenue TaxID=586396 RepID=A0AAV0RI31_9ROSI|nr:unnamed protein product [Linum tenue]